MDNKLTLAKVARELLCYLVAAGVVGALFGWWANSTNDLDGSKPSPHAFVFLTLLAIIGFFIALRSSRRHTTIASVVIFGLVLAGATPIALSVQHRYDVKTGAQ